MELSKHSQYYSKKNEMKDGDTMPQTEKQEMKTSGVKPGDRPVRSCTLKPAVEDISFMPDTFTKPKPRLERPIPEKKAKAERKFVCPCCNISYKSAEAMIDHIKASPIKVKTYNCEVCLLEFFVKADLTDHQRLDHKITSENYKCDECEMDYSSKSQLAKHKRIHQKISENLAAFGIFPPRLGNSSEDQIPVYKDQQNKSNNSKDLHPSSPLNQTTDKDDLPENENQGRKSVGPWVIDVISQNQRKDSLPENTCVKENFIQNQAKDALQYEPCVMDILPQVENALLKTDDTDVVNSVCAEKNTSNRNCDGDIANKESNSKLTSGFVTEVSEEETENDSEESNCKFTAEYVNDENETDDTENKVSGSEPSAVHDKNETDDEVDIDKSHSECTAEEEYDDISDAAVDDDEENDPAYSPVKNQDLQLVTPAGKQKCGRPILDEKVPRLSSNGDSGYSFAKNQNPQIVTPTVKRKRGRPRLDETGLLSNSTKLSKEMKDVEEIKIPAKLLNEDGSIRCPDCNVMCSSMNGLNRHRKFHFQTMVTLKCIFCEAEFGNGMDMGNHMSSAHPLRKCQKGYMMPVTQEFPCTVPACSKVFSASVSLTKHKIKEHGMDHSQANICKDCGRRCQSQSALTIHIRCHTDERPFKCDLCPKAYRSSSSLVLHRKSHCSKKPFICEHCAEGFNSPNSLRRHIRCWHTGEKPYMCDGCGVTFCDYSQLAQHSKSHGHGKLSSPGKYSCDLCGKHFRTEYHIKSHRQRCGTVDPWRPKSVMCEVCGQEFPSNRNLKNHMVTHSNQRPHKCRYCEATFRHYKSKYIHEKMHKGNKNYICPLCGKGFYQGPNLKAHIASHSNKKEFACCMCGKKFNTDSNVKRHEKRCARYLKCPICAAVFRVQHRLIRHLNLNHNREELPQGAQWSPVSVSSLYQGALPHRLEKQSYTMFNTIVDVHSPNKSLFMDSQTSSFGRPRFLDSQISSPNRPRFVDYKTSSSGRPRFVDSQASSHGQLNFEDSQTSLCGRPNFVDSSHVSDLPHTFVNTESDGQSGDKLHIVDLGAGHD